ncbi:MAG: glycosyltransferase family 2 protein [Bacteroidota bacterium]
MSNGNNKISALLITFNEEDNILEVLENLSFADEIIVVDSYSTDKTVELITKMPQISLFQRVFKNYTDQKQFALEQAQNEWVLFLDADERMPDPLIKEVLEVVNKNGTTASAYYFLRTFMFKKQILRFSGWQTDKNYRLFKRDKVRFSEDRIVHETLIVDGPSGTLKNKLIHYSYQNYYEYRSKMIKYGRMKAEEEFEKGKKAHWYHFLFRPFYKFFNHYFLRLGILDGKKGMIICYLNALGVWSRYKALKELNKANR